jgi:hypothetical protein
MLGNHDVMDRLYGLLSLPVLVSYVYVRFIICYTDIT